MDINEWVSLISGIAALLTAAATFYVASQMSKQRSESYKPQLVITRTQFKSQFHEKKGELPYKWERSDIERWKSNSIARPDPFSITVVNVGFGAAKDMTARWTFPAGKLVSSINRAAQESLTPIHFEWKNETLSMKSGASGKSGFHMFWKPQKQQHFDFVLPARDASQNTVELAIPPVCIQLISYLIHLAVKTDDADKYLNDIPPLRCEMEHSDIGGTRHYTNVDLCLTPVIIRDEDFNGFIDASTVSRP